jgi:uncharacterized protein YjiS (DUF1127 family)
VVDVGRYQAYRRTCRELADKIRDALVERDTLMAAGRLLGIARGRTFRLEEENEVNALIDFTLYERLRGPAPVQRYRESIGGQTALERDALEAMCAARTALFRVVETVPGENELWLAECSTESPAVKLVDIGLSRSGVPGMLLFTRVIPCPDFHMGSGIAFVFPAARARYLQRRAQVLERRVRSDDPAIRRFVAYFRLNRSEGIEVEFARGRDTARRYCRVAGTSPCPRPPTPRQTHERHASGTLYPSRISGSLVVLLR